MSETKLCKCPTCGSAGMKQEKLDVTFAAVRSKSCFCICDGCHALDRVLKLELPSTKYHDGNELKTTLRNYWLCRNCQEKLVNSMVLAEDE